MTDLPVQLSGCNGMTREALERLAAGHHVGPESVRVIRDMLASGTVPAQDAATWVVLAWARQDVPLPASLVAAVFRHAGSAAGWMSRLHACQLVRLVNVPPSSRRALLAFLSKAAHDPRPFVRAWALDARCSLSTDRTRRQRLIVGAAQDPAPAVRARARRLAAEMSRDMQ